MTIKNFKSLIATAKVVAEGDYADLIIVTGNINTGKSTFIKKR